MPYVVSDEVFKTKEELTSRCRQIVATTPDGQVVAETQLPFLYDLFQYHDEWSLKSAGGVRDITIKTTTQGTRCFVLRKHDGSEIDISFPHAIRLIPSSRTARLLPQPLRDFRSAARNAISAQIYAFRDGQLGKSSACPLTSEPLDRGNCAVDHTPPNTFDSILFEFCRTRQINPLEVKVGSKNGTVAFIEDSALLAAWQAYHQEKAALRLISRLGNLQLPKSSEDWSRFWA
ncbi:MAG: hypothetical protein BroJett012_20700 [Betaproteobacteria bacterium]|nr:MAG: hypothetical protein BroJett012_20700 [Betaproteobacteria bacterium]